jgi:hypothetical protein
LEILVSAAESTKDSNHELFLILPRNILHSRQRYRRHTASKKHTLASKVFGLHQDPRRLYSKHIKSKEGERPDTLAHKIYGKSDLHWVILLFNEIIDPYYEWPLTTSELDSYIAYKYPGKAVYVEDTFFYADGVMRNQRIDSTEPTINGETEVEISQYEGGEVVTKKLTAVSYDPLMMKVVVKDDGWLDNGVPSIRTMTVTNSNGKRITTNIRYIEPNSTAIHHFVDASGKSLILAVVSTQPS